MRLPLITALLALCASLRALVISQDALNAQLDEAILVAQIHVDKVEVSPDPRFHALFTATCTVQKVLQVQDDGGWFPQAGESIEIEGIGGELNGLGIFISGYPRPYVGHAYEAHLVRRSAQTFQVTGLEFGLRPLSPTRDYTRNRTDGSNGDGTGAFLYWDDTSFPVPYFISETTFINQPDAVPAIDASFRTWRNIQDIKVEFVPMGCSTVNVDQNDGINNVIFVTQNWAFDPSAIAITRNFYVAGTSPKAGLLLDTDILLNATNHQFTVSGEPGKYDVQDIVTHEAGHFLGMGHDEPPNQDPDATMFAVAAPDETKKRTLHPDDLLGIHAGYNGVGQKLSGIQTSSPCVIRNGPVSCGAVHGRRAEPLEFFGILLFLAGTLGAGRVLVYFSRLRS